MTKVAVLGDIHANARALKSALSTVDRDGYDILVFLGDLLTYGIDVAETLELVNSRLEAGNAILLQGNHDALYRDLLMGDSTYRDSLPDWIKESVDLTFDKLPAYVWSKLSFQNEFIIDNILFSHANPFGAKDWQYLKTEADHICALEAMRTRGLQVGIFGHTHRAKWFRSFDGISYFESKQYGGLDFPAAHILNAGSVGQPRDKLDPTTSVLWISVPGNCDFVASFRFENFSWDTFGHKQSLETSNFSSDTLARLRTFF